MWHSFSNLLAFGGCPDFYFLWRFYWPLVCRLLWRFQKRRDASLLAMLELLPIGTLWIWMNNPCSKNLSNAWFAFEPEVCRDARQRRTLALGSIRRTSGRRKALFCRIRAGISVQSVSLSRARSTSMYICRPQMPAIWNGRHLLEDLRICSIRLFGRMSVQCSFTKLRQARLLLDR